MKFLSRIYHNKNFWHVLLLIIIAVLTHLVWFSPSSVISGSDWSHYQNNVVNELYKTAGTWLPYDNLGTVNIQLPFYAFMSVWSFLGNLGIGYDGVTKITFFIPIALLNFIAPYILFKKIFNDRNAAFVCGIFYGTTTYGIANQPPIHFVYALTPLVIYLFILAIERLNFKSWVVFFLVFSLGIVYEVRIMYITTFILSLYVLTFHIRKIWPIIRSLLPALPIVLLLNLFWLLATLSGASLSQISTIANRGLFGNDLFDLPHALTLTNWYWTGGAPNTTFIKQKIPIVMWFLPITLLIAFIKGVFAKNKWTAYFLLISLIGIFLTKQIAPPITTAYPWLYANLPGFNLFRESSKFFLITSIGYAGLIGSMLIAFKRLSKRKTVYNLGLLGLTLLFLLNTLPLINGKIGGLFVSRKVPNAYIILNSMLEKNSGFARTYSLPAVSRWLYYSKSLPKISAVNLVQNNLTSYGGDSVDQSIGLVQDSITSPLTKSYADQMFDLANAKYFILPERDQANDDDFFKFYGDNREAYAKTLGSLNWLTPINVGTSKVKVYENKNNFGYFSSAINAYSIPSFKYIDDSYDFKSTQLNDPGLNFVGNSNKSKASSRSHMNELYDLGIFLNRSNLTHGHFNISKKLPSVKDNSVYSNTSEKSYDYSVENGRIAFSAINQNDLVVNNFELGDQLSKDKLYTANLNPGSNYALAVDTKLYPINTIKNSKRTLGLTNSSINLYSSTPNINLISNGSFENGLWQNRVQDCNKYDNNASIGMRLTNKISTENKSSLVLAAYRHTACTTSKPFAVSADQTLSLTYDYQIKGGQRAGYSLIFNDPKHTTITNDQVNNTGRWFNEDVRVTVPKGATQMQVQLRGYPDEHSLQHAQTYYDNVIVQPLTLVSQIAPATTPTYTKTPLTGSTLDAKIVNSSFTYKNLITNPSLEQGLWRNKVGDCNAYDDKPLIAQSLNKQSKTDGKQSLELDATRHIACTGPNTVDVKEGQSYLLSFDYKSPTQSQAGYYVSFDDPSGTVISEQLPLTDKNWHTFTKTFVVPFGATHISLNVYSYADQYGGIKEINLYDNFYLTQIPTIQNRYYVVSTPKVTLQKPKNITFQLNSPTKKSVQVTAASTPFYLNMSESYHPQWRLELDDAKSNKGFAGWSPKAKPTAVPDADHFNYDDFLNSWYVDPAKLCAGGSTACHKNSDGSYNLRLVAEFAPQRYFYVGLIVSGATLLGCFGYLGRYYYQRRAYTRGIKKSAEHASKR